MTKMLTICTGSIYYFPKFQYHLQLQSNLLVKSFWNILRLRVLDYKCMDFT